MVQAGACDMVPGAPYSPVPGNGAGWLTAVQLATRKKSLISNHWFEFKLMKSVKSHQEFEIKLLV